MRRVLSALALPAAAALLVACGSDETPSASTAAPTEGVSSASVPAADLEVMMLDPAGAEVGTVTASEVEGGLQITVEVSGLPAGFHGFHVHSVGVCEPDSTSPTDPSMTGDFLSAGGHLGAMDASHGTHEGDLPSLFVMADGTGTLTTVTDTMTLADITDEDGSAVMVHADPDNFGNVPERYAPGGPDEMTLATGDSGGRIACGATTA